MNSKNFRITLINSPGAFSDILNEMSDFLESNNPPPDHWDEEKRKRFYRRIKEEISWRTAKMLEKFIDPMDD